MGKTGKWLKSFLTGKKDKDKNKEQEKEKPATNHNPNSGANEDPTTPISTQQSTPKEKRRWSFRRSSSASSTPSKEINSYESNSVTPQKVHTALDAENEQRKHAIAAAPAAASMIRLTTNSNETDLTIEEAAATRIQSVFRSYLARKALNALRGIVKLQALVRGHLVRKQATTTLRCMQALVTAQARARARRIRAVEEAKYNHNQSTYIKPLHENRLRNSYHNTEVLSSHSTAFFHEQEENIKIVEMDMGESKGSTRSRNSHSSLPKHEFSEHRYFNHHGSNHPSSKQEHYQVSPAPSALTDTSPRGCSGHFEDYSFSTAQSSPQYYSVSKTEESRPPFGFPRPAYAESMSYDYPLFPNYMANTESSRAKVRSQSAPKQRPDSFERQPSRRRASVEGRNIPRVVRMQRSSSHVGATAHNYQYPWCIKLDRSTVSLKDSECGSTSTVLTNTNYCRSLVSHNLQPHGDSC